MTTHTGSTETHHDITAGDLVVLLKTAVLSWTTIQAGTLCIVHALVERMGQTFLYLQPHDKATGSFTIPKDDDAHRKASFSDTAHIQ